MDIYIGGGDLQDYIYTIIYCLYQWKRQDATSNGVQWTTPIIMTSTPDIQNYRYHSRYRKLLVFYWMVINTHI